MTDRHDAPTARRDTCTPGRPHGEGPRAGRDPLQTRRLNGPGIAQWEVEMNRGGGVGIVGVIVIVVVILFLVGVIKL